MVILCCLNKEDFSVEEDGTKQEIRSFSSENAQPLAIGMLIDTSPSVMQSCTRDNVILYPFFYSSMENDCDRPFV